MTLPRISVKRPVAVLMCVSMLLVFGITSVFDMEMESTPEMSMPVFMVRTRYEGASPEEVDEMVTDKVESALSAISEVEEMTSRSSEGSSMTMLEFDYSVDMDEKHDDIEDAINRLRLPDGADDPVIMEMSMDNSTIMSLSIRSQGGDNLYTYVEDTIVPELERVSGVSEVSMRGGARDYIKVELHEEEMVQYGVTMNDVANAISSADFNITAGNIHRGNTEITLQGGVSYDTYESLATIPISLPSGDIIHVSDVATVEMTQEERSSISRYNGMETISLSISKNQTANTVAICNEIVEKVDELNQAGLGLLIEITDNSGETIYENIMNVVSSLVQGLMLAVLVLYMFLGDWRASAIVAASMPLSVFAALVLMALFDMTLNVMSLGGLVVGIGMMVDNSIVVLDSCFRHREEIPTFEEAAIEGANLVNSSVIASTITTIVVFLPVALMEGMAGQLFEEIGFTIVFSMTASLVSALSIVPLLFVRFEPEEKKQSKVNDLLEKLAKIYRKALLAALGNRKKVVMFAVAMLLGTAFLFTRIDMELMPNSDEGSISISVSTKTGLDISETDKIMTEVEKIVANQEDVESYSMRGNSGSATITVYLHDDRGITTDEFVAYVREQAKDIDNCQIDVNQRSTMSFGSRGVTINLKGESLSELERAAEQVRELMNGYEGIASVTDSLSDGSPRAEIEVDPIQAAAIGTTPSAVVTSVKNAISGIEANEIQQGGEEYKVKVRYPKERYYDVSDLSGLMIKTRSGGQVPLTDVAQILFTNSPAQIQRSDGDYQVSVTGTPDVGVSATTLSNEITARIHQMNLPAGVTVEQGGNMKSMNDEFSNIFAALSISIYLVFVVMSIQFESMRFSAVVMLSVPFAMTGAFLGLFVSGMSISMSSLVGLIMLVGVVVNNAIVLIDYANILRSERGMEAQDALLEAGETRLRPILMSTLTTVVGLIPTAFGFGGNVEMMQSLSVVVIGGLLVSTMVTLILVPVVYMIMDSKKEKKGGLISKISALFKRIKPAEEK
ncbi:MAG: efflux RND transporter permease subunit [Oscillospiraceae bacterium]|nr:efflux RND transporter permease subunit [Oscillospiraceae bacterium]